MLGSLFAEEREVPRCEIGEGVEDGGPGGMVACCAEDLENGGAEVGVVD